MVQDYSNLKFNFAGLQRYFKDQKISIKQEDSTKLASIFKECDTVNENGEKEPDGVLTGKERENFMEKVEKTFSEKAKEICQRVTEFSIVMELVDDFKILNSKDTRETDKDKNNILPD